MGGAGGRWRPCSWLSNLAHAKRQSSDAEVTSGPPDVDASLLELLDGSQPLPEDGLIDIHLTLRNFPDWDVPLLLDMSMLSAADVEQNLEDRELAIAERELLFDSMAVPVLAEIDASGGESVALGRRSGWIIARVTEEGLLGLTQRLDLLQISDGRGEFEDGAWRLGDGTVDALVDVDRFLAAGYTGERANPNRHSFFDITVAVIESGLMEDEACFLFDGPGCTGYSRLQERFICNDPTPSYGYCESVSNFVDDDDDNHGTATSSIILADYTQGQGNGEALGDAAFGNATCSVPADCAFGLCENGKCAHLPDWENWATGMAPEARLIYFGGMEGTPSQKAAGYADAFDDVLDRHVNIASNSWGYHLSSADVCSPRSNLSFEKEAENAFDDGVFITACAGNGGPAGVCNVWAPGAIPKTLGVNGLAVDSNSSCPSSYHTQCPVDLTIAREGGADTKFPSGTTISGALSLVDLAAPGEIRYTTSAIGARGRVLPNDPQAGCSYATPHVAGLAAVVKDWYLAAGNTWINNPGYLHTIILAMTDRHRGSSTPTSQAVVGASDTYGFGRLKGRLLNGSLGPYFNNMKTYTFVSNGQSATYLATANPMPSGTSLAKCVMYQMEDTSSDANPITTSDVDLYVRVRQADQGVCTAGGHLHYERWDTATDWKHVVALEDGDVGLAGRCLQVHVVANQVEAPGITARIMCYSATTDDDQPN